MSSHTNGITGNGYSLISLLIYLTAFLYISVIIFQYYLNIQRTSKNIYKLVTEQMLLEIISDLMIKDIQRAPAEIILWKEVGPENVIWTNKGKDIGWKVEKSFLVRSEGNYDKKKNRWITRTKSSVALRIKNIKITMGYAQDYRTITKVCITLTTAMLVGEKEKYLCISLINRKL
jgi:hypothetical protein